MKPIDYPKRISRLAKALNDAGLDAYIVTVPTPVDAQNQPDLAPLRAVPPSRPRARPARVKPWRDRP